MKRRCASSTCLAALACGSVALVSGFAPPATGAPRRRSVAAPHRRLHAAAFSPDDCGGPTAATSSISADQPPSRSAMPMTMTNPDELLGALSSGMDMNMEYEDPLQNVLDNTASTSRNGLINLGLLTAVTVAALSALLTIDLAGGITRGWTVAEVAARIPLDDWAFYNDVLHSHPILTKAATSGTVYAIGDVIAQRTGEDRDLAELDRARVGRSLLAGLLAHGPLSHYWYLISEDVFAHVLRMTEWWSVFPKILVDQTVWGPIWTSIYLLLTGLLQGDRLGTIGDNVRKSLVPLTVSGLKLWPAAHVVTYCGIIPVENRLLWVDFVEIAWVTILATQAASLTADDGGKSNSKGSDAGAEGKLAVETR